MVRLDLIVGARPNFVKAAPVVEELRRRPSDWAVRLIHTGQHYDGEMSDLLFRQLEMPRPDLNLGIGSGSHGNQTARMMVALEAALNHPRPDLVMVFGDVNSALAGALVASKMQIPLAHVEAGLRSFDRTMPEEINRVLTDAVSDCLFITERSAEANLQREGIPPAKIHFVGNTMIDTLIKYRAQAERLAMPRRLNLTPGCYAVVTLHRPSNVDDETALGRLVSALRQLAARVPVVFPVHPRARVRLEKYGLSEDLRPEANLRLLGPLGYLEFTGLMADAGVVLTDSGGIQEETTVLNVPCVTLRANTERPVTLSEGTNVLVGNDTERMLTAAIAALENGRSSARTAPEKWDGQAAGRIVEVLDRVMR